VSGGAGYCNGVFGSETECRPLSAAWSNASEANRVSSLAYSRSPLSRALRAKANSRAARSRNWSASDMGHPRTHPGPNTRPYEKVAILGQRGHYPPLNRPDWLNLAASECPSISAVAHLAAWQCSTLAKIAKAKSNIPLPGSVGTAPSRKSKTRNSRPA
jgi:hypothetical protein